MDLNSTIYTFPHEKIGFVSLIDKSSCDFPLKIVNAARLSYSKQKQELEERDRKLIGYLFDHSHTSPFRHSYYTFHIKATLSVFRQWTKYQVGSTWRTYELNNTSADPTVSIDIFDILFDTDKGCSWNEISRRYTSPKEEFYIPDLLRSNPSHGNKQSSGDYSNPLSTHDIHFIDKPLELMSSFTKESINLYNKLIMNGVAKEQARDILPVNLYSEAYWTVSLQAIMHFLTQRCSKDAQFEIKQYALAIKSLIADDLDRAGIKIE